LLKRGIVRLSEEEVEEEKKKRKWRVDEENEDSMNWFDSNNFCCY